MTVAVHSQWNPTLFDDAFQKPEIAFRVFLLPKHRVWHGTRGIIHSQKQSQPRSILTEPLMMTSVYLHQHPLLRHALPTMAMLKRLMVTATGQSGPGQDAPDCGPGATDILSLGQELGEVGMVDSGIPAPGQCNYAGL
jgi:hypothetical protein